ncbi:MAG TPA: Na+:solute symporter [Lacipirellulaceae bacterium]|nr:Na+:solute symporter [Lacipirellulaceae bacterium]
MQTPAPEAPAAVVDGSASPRPVDPAIIVAYLLLIVAAGLLLSRRAGKNLESYVLGGRSLPWYLLGVSNASGMFDISGTMLMVYWLFVYGMKSVWIPWLWPVFNQVFLMIYLSVWMRRSGVMTGAEWIRFRFGDSRGAQLAHFIVVVFAIVNVIGFLAYGFIGIGKFAATFLPWTLHESPAWNVKLYGLLITALTTLYVVKGGMFSVVFTEVFQFIVMTIGCLWVGVIAIQQVPAGMLPDILPPGWTDLWPSWRLNLDWSQILPAANDKIAGDGWRLFGALFALMLLKGCLQSAAGPAPNYDMQRILSTRSPREAALMSGFVNVVLLIPRYVMITGLTLLALAFFTDELGAMGADVDFELVLPLAMKHFVPAGLFGLLIAALLAAFMSTYAATVNAAPAYLVNDIYKRYVNPHASDRTYVWMSYAASLSVVVVGTAFGFFTERLNDIVKWLTFALYGGYIAANVLKWHWWRFNSHGYFWGMLAGIAAAGSVWFLEAGKVIPVTIAGLPKEVVTFPAILAASLLGCVLGSLLTQPDDLAVLKNFYLKTRPWGFWRPIHDLVIAERPEVQPNRNFSRDAVNIVVGIAWQTSLTAAGIYLVLRNWPALAWCAAIIVAASVFLKFNWYDRLQDDPDAVSAAAPPPGAAR